MTRPANLRHQCGSKNIRDRCERKYSTSNIPFITEPSHQLTSFRRRSFPPAGRKRWPNDPTLFDRRDGLFQPRPAVGAEEVWRIRRRKDQRPRGARPRGTWRQDQYLRDRPPLERRCEPERQPDRVHQSLVCAEQLRASRARPDLVPRPACHRGRGGGHARLHTLTTSRASLHVRITALPRSDALRRRPGARR